MFVLTLFLAQICLTKAKFGFGTPVAVDVKVLFRGAHSRRVWLVTRS